MLMHLPALLLLLTGMLGSVWLQKLTLAGAVTGGIIGLLIYAVAGYTGLLMMTLFFVLGTAATAWKKEQKIRSGVAHISESKRTAEQVLANAGMAGLLALLALWRNDLQHLFIVMMAAVFASATADTLSSELGNVYGQSFYNIRTFKRDLRGLNGVVSIEGTLAGLAGSILMALIYVIGFGWNGILFFLIILAGTIGNLFDSILGATLERKGKLNNNGVNFLNTLVASLAALLLYFIFLYHWKSYPIGKIDIMNDVLGQAIWDHYQGLKGHKLWIHNTYGKKEEMPVDVYFRDAVAMPEMERMALQLCKGKVLDVGCGAGSHSLLLQKAGFDVTAIDISPKAVEVARRRGVQKSFATDVFEFEHTKFDTLLMLMNGIGLTGNLAGLSRFLEHAKTLVKKKGQLIFDSSDVAYLFVGGAKPTDRYYGEITYRYEYKKMKTEPFSWLYVDAQTLTEVAAAAGWQTQVLLEDDYDQFLVRLTQA